MNAQETRQLSVSASTRRHRSLAAATALGLVMSLATTGTAATFSTSPGKNSAFEASTGNPLTTFTTQLTATIAKGKKKTVLAIEATYSDGPYTPTPSTKRVLGMNVFVNGIGVQPNPSSAYQYVTDCGFAPMAIPPVACTTTGTFWLDIDAAEQANPGVFVGQPLSVVLIAGDLAAGALVGVTPMDASLTVRVEKK